MSLKDHLIERFSDLKWEDLGPFSPEKVDYPDFADKVCAHVHED